MIPQFGKISKYSSLPAFPRENLGDVNVTVSVTPNGYADAVYHGKFVMPEERNMTMNNFLHIMNNPDSANGVFYVQKQNSNLTDEFSNIMDDVKSFCWAETAFGKLLYILFIFLAAESSDTRSIQIYAIIIILD